VARRKRVGEPTARTTGAILSEPDTNERHDPEVLREKAAQARAYLTKPEEAVEAAAMMAKIYFDFVRVEMDGNVFDVKLQDAQFDVDLQEAGKGATIGFKVDGTELIEAIKAARPRPPKFDTAAEADQWLEQVKRGT